MIVKDYCHEDILVDVVLFNGMVLALHVCYVRCLLFK